MPDRARFCTMRRMHGTFDHLVVAARSLEEGVRWIERELGAAPLPGGEHPLMGTHNALLSLGPGAFLEVIAIDPDAPPVSRPRWFSLDTPAMQRLPCGGKCPTLIQWLGPHPAAALPPSGCDLVHLRRDGSAVLRTAAGERMLPWRIPE